MREFVTGATGFIGSALVLELLESSADHEVVCLSRARGRHGAADRAFTQLSAAAEAYGSRIGPDELRERVSVLEGDLSSLPRLPTDVGRVWHTAASLKFDNRDRAEIEESNVAAVRRLVDCLKAHGPVQLNHFSTAYVAGQLEGDVPESSDMWDAPPNNFYEASKRAGETVIRESGLAWRILRPSIVIGHSRTGQTLSQSGMYGFAGKLEAFKKRVAGTFGELFSNIPMNLLSNPDAGVDLVPVDRCVRAAVHAGTGGRDLGTVTHLTNSKRPPMRDVLGAIFEATGMLEPHYVTQTGLLSSMDQTFSEQIDFYAPYIRQDKRFGQAEPLIAQLTEVPLSRADIRGMVERFRARHLVSSTALRAAKNGGLHV